MWADDYELYSGTITEGDYLIVYDGGAMKNTITNNRFDYQSVTISDNKISNAAATIVWHIAASGNYWTVYNANVSKYAASTGAANKAQLLDSGTDDKSLWTVTGSSTYEFVNKQNTTNKVNANLRKNGTYGFACYATGTGGALSLYKKVVATGAATTVTINSTGITNTNKFLGTAAGTLTAAVTVTSTSDAVEGAAVTWSSSDEGVATVGETTGVVTLVGEGTTTITASYAGKSGEYKSSYAEYELTVTNEDPNAVIIWSEDFSSYNDNDVPDGGDYSYVCTNGTKTSGSTNGGTTAVKNESLAGGSALELMIGKKGSGEGALGGTFSATISLLYPSYGFSGDLTLKYKTNANGLNVKTSTDGITIDGEASAGAGLTYNTAGEHKITIKGVTTSTDNITIVFTATTTSNVRIDDVVLKGSKLVFITPAKPITTFCSTNALNFDGSELKAYAVSSVGSTAVLAEVTDVPASTGLILVGEAGTTYNIPVGSAESLGTTNKLIGTTVATNISQNAPTEYDYVLSNGKFVRSAKGTLPAGKAYLPASALAGGASELSLDFNGETTGIATTNFTNNTNDGVFYNLSGQRVAQPTKGLYIVNGRKVIIK